MGANEKVAATFHPDPEPIPRTVWNTPLEFQTAAEAYNSVLFRLAFALGYAHLAVGDLGRITDRIINADPDELLKEVESILRENRRRDERGEL